LSTDAMRASTTETMTETS